LQFRKQLSAVRPFQSHLLTIKYVTRRILSQRGLGRAVPDADAVGIADSDADADADCYEGQHRHCRLAAAVAVWQQEPF
jgi:hypothetical protein